MNKLTTVNLQRHSDGAWNATDPRGRFVWTALQHADTRSNVERQRKTVQRSRSTRSENRAEKIWFPKQVCTREAYQTGRGIGITGSSKQQANRSTVISSKQGDLYVGDVKQRCGKTNSMTSSTQQERLLSEGDQTGDHHIEVGVTGQRRSRTRRQRKKEGRMKCNRC